jgi:hypothetical protein
MRILFALFGSNNTEGSFYVDGVDGDPAKIVEDISKTICVGCLLNCGLKKRGTKRGVFIYSRVSDPNGDLLKKIKSANCQQKS